MLQINIEETELFNEKINEFVQIKEQKLKLEHSLVSISKWESKYHKPFLSKKKDKTNDEILYYIKCMTLNNCDENIYLALTKENIKDIDDYITDSYSATWFRNDQEPPSRETITSELIYYWMIACGIPFECQKWHINRLLVLIRICQIKNSKGKKMSKNEIRSQNASLNAARRKAMNSRG